MRGEEAELSISDDGAPVDMSTTGMGRTLMTAFARQLRGKVTFETPAEGGMVARLVFPTPTT